MGSLNWTGRRRLPLIRQTESAECGLACLAMMASWHGLQTDLPTLRERFSISTQGMTLQRLIECADGIRLSSRAVRLEPEDLKSLSLPCILHWNMGSSQKTESMVTPVFATPILTTSWLA